MNWEAIGAISEILGAVAVVATLVYLSAQIRQSTKVARSAARQAIADASTGLASDLITGDLVQLLQKHIDGESLKQYELLRLHASCYKDLHVYENIYFQFRDDMLSIDEWTSYRENLINVEWIRH